MVKQFRSMTYPYVAWISVMIVLPMATLIEEGSVPLVAPLPLNVTLTVDEIFDRHLAYNVTGADIVPILG